VCLLLVFTPVRLLLFNKVKKVVSSIAKWIDGTVV